MKKNLKSFGSFSSLNNEEKTRRQNQKCDSKLKGRSEDGQVFCRSRQGQRRKAFREDLTSSFTEVTFEGSELENSFAEFLLRVQCPFCSEDQTDKTELLKHLDGSCRGRKTRGDGRRASFPYCSFQILPNNIIKCNFCEAAILTTIQTYFAHLHSESHLLNCTSIHDDFLYCSCCKVPVPNNYTQLDLHLKNNVHEVRRKSALHSDNFPEDVSCVYAFGNGNERQFSCLCCSDDFFTSNTLGIINHIKNSNHLENSQSWWNQSVYCCFCDETITKLDIPFHFNSPKHLGKENEVSGVGSYEICIFCGCTCNTLPNLLEHMSLNCVEKVALQQELEQKLDEEKVKEREERENIQEEEEQERREKIQERNRHTAVTEKKKMNTTSKSTQEIKRNQCILVKDSENIIKLIKILKDIGKIKYIGNYDEEYLVIEFQKKSSIELILLVQHLIKINGEKVEIKFLEQEEDKLEKIHASQPTSNDSNTDSD